MKRQLSAAAAVLAVIAAGALASACDVTPTAASANGVSISTSSIDSQLRAMDSTVAGGCLLQLQNANLTAVATTGAGGSGTYTMAFANSVINSQVGYLLAQQYAASRGITLSASDLTTAASDYQSTLDGEISQQVSNAASQGAVSYCQLPTGANVTGKQLLAALPADMRDGQVRNQAVDEKLLALGADLSDQAVSDFYNANQANFTQACMSAIVTDTQDHANQLIAQLNGGAPFATVAKANSLDPQTAANGGSLGGNFTLSQVEQSLQIQSIVAGQPVAPIQNSSNGQWIVYEATSQQVEPLSSATSLVKRELLQGTTNVDRVSKEIVAFAQHSAVSINPQYGTWNHLTVVPPVAPPAHFLLAAVGGTSTGQSVLPTAAGSSGG